jgi:pyruvate kinase
MLLWDFSSMKTKILATLGPSSLNKSTIADLDYEGVAMFRLNMSHTTTEQLREYISLIRSVTGTPICIDSEGSKKGTRAEDGSFTQRDIEACRIGREMNINNYALSFAESDEDIVAYRKMLWPSDNLIAKVETAKAISNLQDILLESVNSILIDRGDLSLSVGLINIPEQQSRIIEQVKEKNISVYVATNFLGSMMENKIPTIAEVVDIANALAMGVDGLVLAEETATGRYPVRAVRFLKKIIERYE